MTTNPLVAVTKRMEGGGERRPSGLALWVWCPGCAEAHCPRTVDPKNGSRPTQGAVWEWNERTDEGFSVSPSLLVHGAKRCHSFIRDGHWEFLTDSEHELAGQTVPMVPLPDWLAALASGYCEEETPA